MLENIFDLIFPLIWLLSNCSFIRLILNFFVQLYMEESKTFLIFIWNMDSFGIRWHHIFQLYHIFIWNGQISKCLIACCDWVCLSIDICVLIFFIGIFFGKFIYYTSDIILWFCKYFKWSKSLQAYKNDSGNKLSSQVQENYPLTTPTKYQSVKIIFLDYLRH